VKKYLLILIILISTISLFSCANKKTLKTLKNYKIIYTVSLDEISKIVPNPTVDSYIIGYYITIATSYLSYEEKYNVPLGLYYGENYSYYYISSNYKMALELHLD
jgi:hypothetical protein